MGTTAFDFDDYRAFLRASLEEKAKQNPAFSLRAFARFSGISPSHLSRTLSGQKKLSSSSVHLIANSLGLSAGETNHLLALVELEKTTDDKKKSRIVRSLGRQAGGRTKVLSLENFQVLSDWYHFAILALAKTRGFQASSLWLAQRLGIRSLDAKFALERLVKLGLLEKHGSGWRAADDGQISTTDDLASAAIRENHRQHLQLAEKALAELAVEVREFNNLTLAMNLGDIPKAKRKIRAFIDEFNREMERDQAQEIFQLNVQFYPLSRREKGQA